MSSVVRRGDPCQPLLGQDYAEEARAGGSELSRERTQAPGQGTTERGGIKGARRAYRIDRCRTFTKRTRADDLENWIEAAKETFSTPSKGLGGEKGSVCVLDGADAESSPARGVYGPEGPARCVPGGDAASVAEGSSSLLDYTLTQGEKEKASFKRFWRGYVSSLIDTYQFRAVVAGHWSSFTGTMLHRSARRASHARTVRSVRTVQKRRNRGTVRETF